jgi:hypothetical protein
MIKVDKLMRTVRVRNEQNPETLGTLLLAISNAGGEFGEINLIQDNHRAKSVISPYMDTEEQMQGILRRFLQIRYSSWRWHEVWSYAKGKIAIRSRMLIGLST